jgi:hypothetical protein
MVYPSYQTNIANTDPDPKASISKIRIVPGGSHAQHASNTKK